MKIDTYKEELRWKLTGGVLDLELSDDVLDKILNSSLREIRRYINTSKFITIPFQKCIKLNEVLDENKKPIKVSSISNVYRTEGFANNDNSSSPQYATDPILAAQWQMLVAPANMRNFQDYAYNYMSYNTLLQIRNTTSTDLYFVYNKYANELYINTSVNIPSNITIEYIPRFDDIEDVTSDYWIDILMRMAVALCKITVGRIRSRYTQSNALWSQDGDTLLNEGNQELNELREHLVQNSNLMYPID